MRGRPYTSAELARIDRMRAAGLSWTVIAERLGRSENSLAVTYCKWRQGQIRFVPEKRAEENALIERLLMRGTSMAEIGRRLGIVPQSVERRLTRMGLDAEMRREIRSGAYLVAAE